MLAAAARRGFPNVFALLHALPRLACLGVGARSTYCFAVSAFRWWSLLFSALRLPGRYLRFSARGVTPSGGLIFATTLLLAVLPAGPPLTAFAAPVLGACLSRPPVWERLPRPRVFSFPSAGLPRLSLPLAAFAHLAPAGSRLRPVPFVFDC